MGSCSSCSTTKHKKVIVPSDKFRRLQSAHPLVTEDSTPLQKAQALEAIKKDDLVLFLKELVTTKPMENLRARGENYTCLHAAAQFNSFRVMEVMLKWIKDNRPAIFKALNNIQDAQGNSPPMVCAINNSPDTLYVMYCYEAIDLTIKNDDGNNLEELCKKYSLGCLKVLETGQLNAESGGAVQEVPELSVQDKQLNIYLKKFVISQLAKYEESLLVNSQYDLDISLRGIRANAKIYKILANFVKASGVFDDKEFPKELISICPLSEPPDSETFKKAVWKRPHEFFKCDYDKINLFDMISPHQIIPGIVSKSYILSVLATIAEYPTRLSKIFINKKKNQFGVYSLRFLERGIPTEFVIDDYIPCDPETLQPLFSKPNNTELWVLLLEKAWAKRFGSYYECLEGSLHHAFTDLLGCPSAEYLMSGMKDEEIWQDLMEASKSNYLMCASTKNPESPFIAGRAYAIISVHQSDNHYIIKIRNIWNKINWNGQYSDHSYLWTLDLKAQVGFTQVEDGVICLSYAEFKTFFERYTIAYYEDNWRYNYLDIESQPKHAEYVKFKLESPTEIYISLHQKDCKHIQIENRAEFQYSPAELIIAKMEEGGIYSPVISNPTDLDESSFTGARTTYPSILKKLKLEKGEYILRMKVRWNDGHKNNFTLSTYADKEIELTRMKSIKDFLPKIFQSLAQSSDLIREKKTEKSTFYSFYGNFFYFYAENNSLASYTITLTLKEAINFRLGKLHKASVDSWKIAIAPKKSEVVFAKRVNSSEEFSFKDIDIKYESF